MKYKSTRGEVAGLSFKQAVMMGLADDGGLLIPETIPDISSRLPDWQSLSYTELAVEIISLYTDDIPTEHLRNIVQRSYAAFDDPLVTPLVKVGDQWVMELFHGPTLAFKDIALQLLGNLFDYILGETGEHLNILGATSGDTGSAAIAGVRGRKNIDIYIMFPEGRTSPVQELQMTTILDENVHNIALTGSFDDCQAILKTVFSDLDFKTSYHLGAVNSVNWARVLAQVVYYFSAYLQLGSPAQFQVAVPTGNFGNIFAAFLARRMGLPLKRLILATNDNDILARFFNTGIYERGQVHFSHSPAMDIQVASNFERYLYYGLGESASKVRETMAEFLDKGVVKVPFNTRTFDPNFVAASTSDEDTVATIRSVYKQHGYTLDPHTAVGVHAAAQYLEDDVPTVCMATAHPAKFPSVVHEALPDHETTHVAIEALKTLPTRKTELSVEAEAVKQFIVKNSPSPQDPLS